ncbi:MAG: LuxR C-terminal-related transcriptional regulator [Flavobacteriaceae bacterium]
MIKIVVIDKHPVIRVAFDLFFKEDSNITLVKTLQNASDAFDYLASNEVDVVITEIDLPDLNGITALRAIKKSYENTQVIMFSSQPEEIYAISTLKAGASGYINKGADLNIVKDAILKVNRGETYLSDSIAKHLIYDDTRNLLSSKFKKLSSREIEVLKLLSQGRKNKEIASELEISEKTVSTYKTRLYKKMEVTNLVDLIHQTEHLQLT